MYSQTRAGCLQLSETESRPGCGSGPPTRPPTTRSIPKYCASFCAYLSWHRGIKTGKACKAERRCMGHKWAVYRDSLRNVLVGTQGLADWMTAGPSGFLLAPWTKQEGALRAGAACAALRLRLAVVVEKVLMFASYAEYPPFLEVNNADVSVCSDPAVCVRNIASRSEAAWIACCDHPIELMKRERGAVGGGGGD